jgi:hypothetical protein
LFSGDPEGIGPVFHWAGTPENKKAKLSGLFIRQDYRLSFPALSAGNDTLCVLCASSGAGGENCHLSQDKLFTLMTSVPTV